MPYLNYNLPIHRTGFRPYGLSNPWQATQLAGMGAARRQIFSATGGRTLGQWQRGFSPNVLHGLGQPAVCLDQNQNTVPCSDPECTYGDCGSTAPQITIGALCLDQHQNQINCTDPNCTYGDCLSSPIKPLPPGPSPRVTAPMNLFWATAPPTATPTRVVATSTTSSWMQYLPVLAIAAMALVVAGSGRR